MHSDPDWAHFSLGTASALLEIALIRRMREGHETAGSGDTNGPASNIAYYYLGYYLPDCAKLAYKARFQPSELLDPVTLAWAPMGARGTRQRAG